MVVFFLQALQKFLQQVINDKTKITSPLIAAKVAWFFGKFAETDEGMKMATTNEVYDVIINHCAKHATTPESVEWLSSALNNICDNNPAGLKLFATSEFISALKNAEKYATTYSSKTTLNGFCLKLLEDFLKQNEQEQK